MLGPRGSGMIRIYTYSHNRPDLIEPQYDSLKKHIKDDFEFIVFNNEREVVILEVDMILIELQRLIMYVIN